MASDTRRAGAISEHGRGGARRRHMYLCGNDIGGYDCAATPRLRRRASATAPRVGTVWLLGVVVAAVSTTFAAARRWAVRS